MISRLKIQLIAVASVAQFCIAWSTPCDAAFTFDPDLYWRTLKTEHFNIHYHDNEQNVAKRTATIAERVYVQITRFFDWEPYQATEIVLLDRMDFANAFAVPVPRNTMYILDTPPDDVDVLTDYDDWLELVISHEYTHIVHIDKVRGLPQYGRNLFGRIVPFFPNALQPYWVLEGMATYFETKVEPNYGRGNNNVFRALMRLEVLSGIKPLSQVNLPIITWPAGTTRYLYGVYFLNFLRDRYGEAALKQWVSNYSDNLIPFMINTNARSVFGKDMDALWAEFATYLTQTIEPQLQQIQSAGIAAGDQITSDGYMTGFPRSLSNGDILYFRQDFLSQSQLMLKPKDGSPTKAIANVYSGRFDVHPDAGILLTQIDFYHNVNSFSDIYRIESLSGKITQLTRGQRYQHAVWSPDAKHIIATQTNQGQTALHLLSARGKFEKQLWKGNQNEVIAVIDWHPSGKYLVASVWRPDTHWNLELFDLETFTWRQLTHNSASELQPQFCDNGKSILYSADYDGVFNIYKFNLDNHLITKLTNVLGGALSATMTPDGKFIYYMGQNANGTDIYRIATTDAVNKVVNPDNNKTPTANKSAGQPTVPAAGTNSTPLANNLVNDSTYTALDKVSPTGWYPYALFDKDHSQLGVLTSGSDPLFWHSYSTTIAYDVKGHWWSGYLNYSYDRWRTAFNLFLKRDIIAIRNGSDQLNSYRNDDTMSVEAILPFIRRSQQWSLHAGVTFDREYDKKLESGGIVLPTARDELVGLAVTYNSAKKYSRSISRKEGYLWRLVAEDSDLLNSDYTGQVYTADWRGYFDLSDQQVLALRLVTAKGTDYPNPFRLGGTNKGYALAAPATSLFEPSTDLFNKRRYALRGYPTGLTELTGRRMQTAELEWRFPISLVESGIMAPPIGIERIHGNLFYNIGDAWNDNNESAKYLAGAGFELNTEIVLGYILPLNLRIGYAHGFDKLGENQFYLELGTTY